MPDLYGFIACIKLPKFGKRYVEPSDGSDRLVSPDIARRIASTRTRIGFPAISDDLSVMKGDLVALARAIESRSVNQYERAEADRLARDRAVQRERAIDNVVRSGGAS
jgi:hypothetical protein